MSTLKESLVKAAARGAASGLLGSWFMAKAQARMAKLGSEATRRREKATSGEPATYKVARRLARPLGFELTEAQKARGGELVHYAYGAAWGAVFGVAFRRARMAPLALGLLFGVGLWLVSDEGLVPLLGFARGPAAYPLSTHAKALGAHLAYGVATAEGEAHLLRG